MKETEANYDMFFIARLNCIIEAAKNNFELDNPELQSPQWLRFGVRLYKSGVVITPKIIDDLDRSGGTDHPDPTIYTSK